MSTTILMPALSPTMEKGTLVKWLKKEGDQVKSGDVIAEIETDKATMEVEAVDEGVLAKILVPDGTEDVAVNQPIGIVAAEGEDVKAAAQTAGRDAASSEAKPAHEAGQTSQAESYAPPPPQEERQPEGAPSAGKATANGHARDGERIFASPLARRLAKDAGIDLASVKGSGPHGRVIERDVKDAKPGTAGARTAAAPEVKPQPQPGSVAAAKPPLVAPPSDEAVRKLFEEVSYEAVPNDGMRKTIARRLTEAKQTIPHFYLTMDCEIDALLALREEVNKSAPLDKEGDRTFKVSVNDFIIKALAMAMMRVPDANATWTEAAILKHKHADVGVAVAIPGGLITPIVRKADQKTISAISNEMKDMAARAKNRRLKPEEYTGGTTAVSNLGMFGVREFAAVINPPHSTILAVGEGEKRVVVKNGEPAVATIMTVTLSTDHRAVDGALGARLLGAFKNLIEHPMGMLV